MEYYPILVNFDSTSEQITLSFSTEPLLSSVEILGVIKGYIMTIQNLLETITQVENWNSINFGILPGEDPKGFIFPLGVEINSPSRHIITYAVGISISEISIELLMSKVLEISGAIAKAFSTQAQCIDGKIAQLTSNIDIEIPQSYPNQSNVSLTTGFFTAITFTIQVG
jgi:tetrahydromethanopterin S-methyltransferase subunit B